MSAPMSRTRRTAVSALAAVAVAGLTLSAVPEGSAAPATASESAAKPSPLTSESAGDRERKASYDSRMGTAKTQLREARSIVADRGASFDRFAKSLGSQAVLDYDTATGTPSNLSRLDGFLTGPSAAPARQVAMSYVNAHLTDLGLTKRDLGTFSLRKDYVDVAGIHHLSYTQSVAGIPVFGNGLKANVTKNGQLISLQGSPLSGLAGLAAGAGTTPSVSASGARSAAAKDVDGTAATSRKLASRDGTTRWKNHDSARLVYFLTSNGLRLGWATYVQAQGGDVLNYQHVIDAQSGTVLYRFDTTNFDRGDAWIYENYPGAPVGGKRKLVNLYDAGYIDDVEPNKPDQLLYGNYTAAWADLNDDNGISGNEVVDVPGTANNGNPQYKLTPFNDASGLCSPQFVCTWDPNEAGSWFTNMREDVTEAFWHNSNFHDYLEKGPIGFTAAAGNFEAAGDDQVYLNALDGANTDNGLPDGNHIDNANMSTPPDGNPPLMQMYLFHFPGTTDEEEPLPPDVVRVRPERHLPRVHARSVEPARRRRRRQLDAAQPPVPLDGRGVERLLRDGLPGLPGSRARHEGIRRGLEGKYLMGGEIPFRTMAIDCPVASTVANCTSDTSEGGYTYGDVPTVNGTGPEVHASGEIWAQTLWDLRKKLGRKAADMVITRGMELSAADPTFLDMRNAIVQADLAVYGGSHRSAIWKVFAKRGMGWYAGTFDSADGNPVEDFHVPPAPNDPRSTVSGQVLDAKTGAPVANALVAILGHDSGYTGDYTAVTDSSGRYTMQNVYTGTYPLVAVFGPGYEVLTQPLTVTIGSTNADFEPRRDWVSSSGGGTITDFNGPDYTDFGCGPGGAIDLSQSTGWGSTTGDDGGNLTNVMIPKHITVKLPTTITLDGLAVNPSSTCGDPGSSSTGDYRIEASTTARPGRRSTRARSPPPTGS